MRRTLLDVSTCVGTVVCGYALAELPASWVQVFRRCERAFARARLDVRVRLDPLEELPDSFEILVVAPELRERALAMSRGARVVAMTREDAPKNINALIEEIGRGETLRADQLRAGAARVVLVRGSREL
jgi:hypothetical protein